MTQAIGSAGATSAFAQLATLLVEVESNQTESNQTKRDAARAAYLEHAQDQVDALNSAADSVMVGAFSSAAFSVAGGALTIASAMPQCDADGNKAAAAELGKAPCHSGEITTYLLVAGQQQSSASILTSAGSTLAALAKPADAFADGTAQRYRAEAKREETLGQQAQWQASDATTAIDKADRQTDKYLQLLQSVQDDQHASNNAIIGRI